MLCAESKCESVRAAVRPNWQHMDPDACPAADATTNLLLRFVAAAWFCCHAAPPCALAGMLARTYAQKMLPTSIVGRCVGSTMTRMARSPASKLRFEQITLRLQSLFEVQVYRALTHPPEQLRYFKQALSDRGEFKCCWSGH